jgi:hypothetical protein
MGERERARVAWVRQEHANGCGPACVAMIVGITYAEACAAIEVSPSHGHRGSDWETGGTNHMAVDHVLQQHGFWRQRTYRAWCGDEHWPPEPWAPVHLCQVDQPSGNAHFVVMAGNGTVLDPLQETSPHGLGVYKQVLNVCGLRRD